MTLLLLYINLYIHTYTQTHTYIEYTLHTCVHIWYIYNIQMMKLAYIYEHIYDNLKLYEKEKKKLRKMKQILNTNQKRRHQSQN